MIILRRMGLPIILTLVLIASTAQAYPVSVGEYIKVTSYSTATGGGEFTMVTSGNVTFQSSAWKEMNTSPRILFTR